MAKRISAIFFLTAIFAVSGILLLRLVTGEGGLELSLQ